MHNPVPLAIVGIGCRFPIAIDGFEAFRRALVARCSMIRRVPADRWQADRFHHPDPRRKGHMHAILGGFLDGIDQFDAGFFGIGAAEAARMDPQQRLALETAYRALEDAGWPIERVAGSRIAAVYGVSARDYDAIQTSVEDRARIGPATNTGSAASIVANRVSYTFDLRGPSFAVDTACSSSLTALHLAARAIAAGDADAALVGGVNLVLRPEPTIGFSQGGYLSPDGACHAFCADANGYVRGEGAATVLVRPLRDAVRDGDRIWAIVRGTAANQDGHAAAMTAPSVEAQIALLRAAYADAGVDPRQVAYVEAHGTGTPVGDPVEARAIGAVLGGGRRAPLPIGSVKTLLGHLESAAGMAGLLKLTAALHDRTVYPNLGFRAPNPEIPFEALGIRVAVEVEALPAEGALYGGVNAFGFGGANAHAVLESPPGPRAAPEHGAAPTAVYFSARTPTAARALAGALADAVLPDPQRLVAERSSFEHRVVVRGADPVDLATRLSRFAAGDDGSAATARLRDPGSVGVVFVFGGQGTQWYGMARGLLCDEPVFARAVDDVADALRAHGWEGGDPDAVRRELGRDAGSTRMAETRVAQPCLFAVQVGLARVLASHGVVPEVVVGHSIGELAAAHVAGCLDLSEAARLVVARSEVQASAEGSGAMAAVGARPDELPTLLAPFVGRLEVAAYNGPALVSVAGDVDAIAALGERAAREGRFFRRVDVGVPFHCHLMAPLEVPFLARVGAVSRRPGDVPFVSTVTAGPLAGDALDAAYFFRNIREPVRFTGAVSWLIEAGHTLFVELGPHPAHRRGALDLARTHHRAVTWLPTLTRDGNDAQELASCLDALHLAGARVWPSSGGAGPLPRVPLEPTRHWNESRAAFRRRTGADRGRHPHLGEVRDAERRGGLRATAHLSAIEAPYLGDHRVQGVVVFPGAGQLELCAAAAAIVAPNGGVLEDVAFRLPVEVGDDGTDLVLDAWGPDGDFTLTSDGSGDGTDAVVHTRGRIRRVSAAVAAPVDLEVLRARFARGVSPEELYRDARDAGLELGPTFRGITAFHLDGREVLARIDAPAELAPDLDRFLLHPALLDAAIQATALGALSRAVSGSRARGLYLPAGVGRFAVARPHGSGRLWCHARTVRETADVIEACAIVCRDDGEVIASIDGLTLRHVRGTDKSQVLRGTRAYGFVQGAPVRELPPARPALARETWVVFGESALADRVRDALRRAGAHLAPADPGPIAGLVDLSSLDRGPLAARLARVSAAVGWGARQVRILTRADGPDGGAWRALARVITSEVRDAQVTTVTLDGGDEAKAVAWLLSDVAGEFVVIDGGVAPVRIERAPPPDAPPRAALDRDDVQAVVATPGQLALTWFPARAPQPGPGEVLVDVEAVGLNFKDVVTAMGLLPARAWAHGLTDIEPGLDFAGVVRAAGPETSFTEGDPVLGLARHCLASYTLADARLVVRRPDTLAVNDAAALPTIGLTAIVALERLARLQAGETVLVHGGAGGVGQLAIQVAHALGAQVIASAGSPERRAWVARLGVAHVVDSRSPAFQRDVMAITDGRGVDVVLNALTGELLDAGLRSLAPFGRFVEIGKVDVYDNHLVGLEGLGENRALFVLDINRWAGRRPTDTGVALRDLVDRAAAGLLTPPPVRALPFDRAGEALDVLAHGRHAGKVVVTRSLSVPVARPGRLTCRGTALVTGGTSGFGLAVAHLLAERGARRVVLASRSGAVDAADAPTLDAIRAAGAEVEQVSLDVRDEAAVAARVAACGPDLRTVVHAAMVLDDAPLAAHDEGRFARVLGPKVDGAVHLHRATCDRQLDHFVLVSSIAAAVGTPGQAAYAAANGFLDAFAAHRRRLGLPATSVAFGPLADVGVVARADDGVRRKILAHGVGELRVGEALSLLEGAVLEDAEHRVVASVDWDRVRARLGDRFAHLAGAQATVVAEGTPLAAIGALPPTARPDAVVTYLVGVAAALVGTDALDPDVPLSRMGLDSLVGTELASRIAADLRVTVPLVKILRGPTVRELAAEVAPRIGEENQAHRWVRRAVAGEPSARLFGFLPLGGDPDAYEAWREHLPEDTEILTVELPLRLGDVDGVDALRDQLVAELGPLCDLPFALYGHSVGGWTALEVAAGLRAAGHVPRFVALGAVPTPDLLRQLLPTVAAGTPDDIDDDHVLGALRTLRVSERALAAPETRERLLAATRRDLWLGSGTWSRALPTYTGDVLVARGVHDPLATLGADDVDALGLRCVASVELPAGHLFHEDPSVRAHLAKFVARTLATRVTGEPCEVAP